MDDRLKQAFDFIVKFKREHDGVAPTVQEICNEVGWASKNSGAKALTEMEERGWIRLNAGARMIEVIGGQWVYEGRQ